MTDLERTIWRALDELDGAVKSRNAAHPSPNVLPLLTRLDELTAQLPKDAPPDLAHYLRRKSYEKARLWLEGRNAENTRGQCEH